MHGHYWSHAWLHDKCCKQNHTSGTGKQDPLVSSSVTLVHHWCTFKCEKKLLQNVAAKVKTGQTYKLHVHVFFKAFLTSTSTCNYTHTTVVFWFAATCPVGLFPPNHRLVALNKDLLIPFLEACWKKAKKGLREASSTVIRAATLKHRISKFMNMYTWMNVSFYGSNQL